MPPSTKAPKGTRDLSPLQTALRNRLFDVIIKTFRKHGADEIDTPVFELKETLTNKYGEDSKLIYDLADQGGEALSLRYDLTVPLARYVASHKIDALKRYHIAKVYRRDNPAMTRGRFREFYQCDFDICGAYDVPLPDVECAQIVCEIFTELNLSPFKCKISHRKILFGYLNICKIPENLFHAISSSIDKMDKTPWDVVKEEMGTKGLDSEIIKNLENFIFLKGGITLIRDLLSSDYAKNSEFEAGLRELKLFFEYAQCFGIEKHLEFDLSLARGLDYYTGVIFEFIFTEDVDSEEGGVGSVAGGGRYDELVGFFKKGHKVPAVGISVGVERLLTILEKKSQNTKVKIRDVKVLVSSTDSNLISHRLSIAKILWEAGIPTEIKYKIKGNTLRDFQYCETHMIPYVVIVGQDEISEDSVVLRRMSNREQAKVKINNLVEELRKRFSEDGNN